MIGRVLWVQEPPFPARRIGKCCPCPEGMAYQYDDPAHYRLLDAYGIAETVLVEMLRADVRIILYRIDGWWRQADRDAVIADGIRDRRPGARGGYLYWPRTAWKQTGHSGHLTSPWVSESSRITLPWRVDAPELRDWRARILAARPVAPAQLSMFA